MKVKKIPLRTCVITKEKLEKKELLRILRTPAGEVILDKTLKANGRGAYLKRDIEVINLAQNNKILEKILEVKIPDNIYLEAKNICK